MKVEPGTANETLPAEAIDQDTVIFYRPRTAARSRSVVPSVARKQRKREATLDTSPEKETPGPRSEDSRDEQSSRKGTGTSVKSGSQSSSANESSAAPRRVSHTPVSSISSVKSKTGSQSSSANESARSVSHTAFSSSDTSVSDDGDEVDVRARLSVLVRGRHLPEEIGVAFGTIANMIYGVEVYLGHFIATSTPGAELIEKIKAIAREVVLIYDSIKAQLVERVRILADVKMYLPSLKALHAFEDLETAHGIWREKLK